METFFIAWAVSGLIMLLVAWLLGKVIRGDSLGILVDSRGRYSLTQVQIVVWTIVVLSLVFGVFFARLLDGDASTALSFDIPDELLLVMGISVGSAVVATAVKTAKDSSDPERIAASNDSDRPRLAQIFLLEEGQMADRAIDVTKFQNFLITVVLVIAYVALAADAIGGLESIDDLTSLPAFGGTFVVLLGISHAAYLAGKLPSPAGTPEGLTVALKEEGAEPAVAAAAARRNVPKYQPRNPN
jgi:hypothetical protein